MLASERPQFETLVKTLCAGFNVPATPERIEGFWTGLAKMPLSQFMRAVPLLLGETGPDKFPTPKHVWQYARQQSARAGGPAVRSHRTDASRLCEYVTEVHHRQLSDRQRAMPWSYIVRWFPDPTPNDPARKGVEYLGVIVPQDPNEPDKFPAIRVLLADVADWRSTEVRIKHNRQIPLPA